MNTATLVAFGLIAFAVMSAQAADECRHGDGATYRGTMDHTSSGKKCQAWGDQSAHKHDYTDEKYPGSDLKGAYCRNPDGSDEPWCFTTESKVRFESCTLDVCGPKKCSDGGKEYSPGQTWRSGNCNDDCICYEDGQVRCIPAPLNCPNPVHEKGDKCLKCPAPAPEGKCQDAYPAACKKWFAKPDVGCTKPWLLNKCPVTCKACPADTLPAPSPPCADATLACSKELAQDCGKSSAVDTACPQTCKKCAA